MDETSAVFRLEELAQYQDGSIVSRKLTTAAGGNVTVFAFAAGEELSEHTTPFDALVFVLEGQAEVSISGTPHPVKAGEMIIMPADKPHALRAVEAFKMALIMIRS